MAFAFMLDTKKKGWERLNIMREREREREREGMDSSRGGLLSLVGVHAITSLPVSLTDQMN